MTSKTDKSLIRTLNGQLQQKQARAEEIAAAFPSDEKGRFSIPTEMYRDYTKVVGEAQEIKGLLDAARAAEQISTYLAEPEGPPAAGSHYSAAGSGGEVKTLGDMFVESDAYKRAASGGFQDRPFIRAGLEGKSIFNMSAGSVTHQTLGSAQNLGITDFQRRKFHIRDLFPKSTTKASVLYGVRETGWVNAAKQVKQRYAADGISPATGGDSDTWGRAPRSKINLKTVLFPVAEIAHLLDAHKNILSDEPRLRTFLNTRMIEGVKFAEDWDLLHSTGDGESITGLFNSPGVQTYEGKQADKPSVQIRRAITRCLLAEYDPTGLVISPTAWEHVEVEEDNTGAFRVAIQVAIGAEKKIWRLQVVETTAMPDEQYLVGSFGLGAQLHDRESVSVTVSSENGTNYEQGIVTFRADERVSLEVVRPESFTIGTWA